ncbi:MAG: VOC family virulence protein [Proteobacteria bacterium]|jgi:Lactoylglutathione lyase and related lyases|nr:MAG: VOC family virulence protein [Pseudomonadota bacterium]
MRVVGFDHLVLTVASIERSAEFYERVLGMKREVFGPERRTALVFGPHKINLHETGREFKPKAAFPTPGSADLCLLVEGFEGIPDHLAALGVPILEGPVERTGARGRIISYYIRDPDMNLIELSHYPGSEPK